MQGARCSRSRDCSMRCRHSDEALYLYKAKSVATSSNRMQQDIKQRSASRNLASVCKCACLKPSFSERLF